MPRHPDQYNTLKRFSREPKAHKTGPTLVWAVMKFLDDTFSPTGKDIHGRLDCPVCRDRLGVGFCRTAEGAVKACCKTPGCAAISG